MNAIARLERVRSALEDLREVVRWWKRRVKEKEADDADVIADLHRLLADVSRCAPANLAARSRDVEIRLGRSPDLYN
ncbi:hypothetical protein FHW79_005976 [Azospirillum sp. OGB3]|uniref:hypothetical protein n=1 Tax=Azospirillum sp. OGB3 TaxID=2587012 RepID=UPI001606F2DF|nr:hypothetical protein [Azospirillum sp. OGB3]MBB3268301.1 hypothetical protein [Azospirillum sp. OGB3]